MKKVTTDTFSTLERFSKSEAFDIADTTGTTAKQIMQSMADFMRLGESFE